MTETFTRLLVLVAWALRDGKQPLITLRVQLWVRELRCMVGKLACDPTAGCVCCQPQPPIRGRLRTFG